MKTIKRNEISEEVRYVTECPYCGCFTDLDNDYNDYSDEDICESCKETFKIED